MATTKERILLVGLPRSGTTVVANYINSMERAFCFLEPHWELKLVGKTRFFRDPKLRWLFFLRYQEGAKLPLDDAVRRIQRRYDLVGIKETFRGDHYSRYDPKLPNEELLADYVDAGYRLIPILRRPLAVWNSWRGFFTPQDTYSWDLHGFIENYRRLYAFAGDTAPLIYERFVQDPAQEMARSGISSEDFGGRLKKRRSLMGDSRAKRSTEVTRVDGPIRYTREQQQVLEASDITRLYDEACDRSGA